MNAQPTTEPQTAPVESKYFRPVLFVGCVVALGIMAWQVVVEYRIQSTSGLYLVCGFLVGLVAAVCFLTAPLFISKVPTFTRLLTGDQHMPPLLLVSLPIAIPMAFPAILVNLFYFHTVLDNEALKAIKNQAQGMIFVGLFLTMIAVVIATKWFVRRAPSSSQRLNTPS